MKRGRILLVEDDHVTSTALEKTLRKFGYDLAGVVATGEEAIELVQKECPDLVLMDIHLRGDLDGIDTSRILWNESHVPVVFLSGRWGAETFERMRECNPYGFVVKPFDDRQLQTTLEMALRRHALERDSFHPGGWWVDHQALSQIFCAAGNLQHSLQQTVELLLLRTGMNCGEITLHPDLAVPEKLYKKEYCLHLNGPNRWKRGSFLHPHFHRIDGCEMDDWIPIPGGTWLETPIFFEEGLKTAFFLPIRHQGKSMGGLLLASATSPVVSQLLRNHLRELAKHIGGLVAWKIEHERLKQDQENMQGWLDSVGEPLLVCDFEGKILRGNSAAALCLNLSEASMPGRRLTDFIPPQETVDFMRFLGDVIIYQTGFRHQRIIRSAENHVLLEMRGSPGTIGADKVISLFCRDIRGELSREFQLQRARDEAERANQAKSAFLAHMSHELRTPLSGIIGTSDLLSETQLTPQQEDLVQTIKDSGDVLLKLVNDILDLSKIEAGKLQLETTEFELADLIDPILEVLGERACLKNVELRAWHSPLLEGRYHGDVTRLRQILLNLVGNAVKFTSQGVVKIFVLPRETDKKGHCGLRFEVQDSGIGINQQAKADLFKPFSQADASVTRKFGGTGLGLTISKHLVTLMNGMIGVESEHGRGSCFWFTVDLPWEGPLHETTDAGFQGKKALVISPNSSRQKYLQKELEILGFEVHAESAIPHSQSSQPDLLLVDSTEEAGTKTLAGIPPHFVAKDRTILLIRCTDIRSMQELSEKAVCRLLTQPCRRKKLKALLQEALGEAKPVLSSSPVKLAEKRPRFSGTILVVDDEPVNRKLAQMMLTRLGFTVALAENGRIALAEMQKNTYCAVLMDGRMPEMSGLEATRRFRDLEPAGQHQLIIALTANATSHDAQCCRDAGMDDFLAKPIHPQDLERMLLKWLKPEPSHPGSHGNDSTEAPVLDPRQFRQLMDISAAEELVANFLQGLEDWRGKVDRAIAEADLRKVREIAHALKGTSSNFGAFRLMKRCGELEKEAVNNHVPAPGFLEIVEEEIRRAREELEKALPQLKRKIGNTCPNAEDLEPDSLR